MEEVLGAGSRLTRYQLNRDPSTSSSTTPIFPSQNSNPVPMEADAIYQRPSPGFSSSLSAFRSKNNNGENSQTAKYSKNSKNKIRDLQATPLAPSNVPGFQISWISLITTSAADCKEGFRLSYAIDDFSTSYPVKSVLIEYATTISYAKKLASLGEISLHLDCNVVDRLNRPLIIGFHGLKTYKAAIDSAISSIRFPSLSSGAMFGVSGPSTAIANLISLSNVFILAMVSIPANLSFEKIVTIVAGSVQFNKQDLDTMKTVNLNIKTYIIIPTDFSNSFDNSPSLTTHLVEHHIDTGSDHLSLLFLYRALAIENETISSLIIEMLQSSVIRRSQAHRASFIMLVIKSDDIVRIYVHCRRLNVKTTKGVCPLTSVDDTFYSLDNAKCFSTIGLISSYWQIKSHSKCSFISG
ncbi:hypothetical protein G6F57_006296 [Rhizopus arrhizus]|nr:hypothetical protein G6F30_002986 [Rhizopus arrhizus]KAG1423593.1 hypothetical protein G6F58_002761 [Rhizopus delemar]KAG0987264.1 hypothetical protein G6F29_002643 [Rhizopus arrhizus]KAG0997843.1 hypothetical protein G6F28_002517 [Rhizopus arrhizus]KAG1012476.1 hypothetical protein G6F27_002790 [Rhizopus arrhizus]